MNKKYFLGMFAAAGMLLATSCSNDELIEQGSGDMATVSFNITTEGAPMSRAISDGSGANALYWSVFTSDGTFLKKGENKVVNKTATVNVTLAKGQTYKLAFFAKNSKCSAYTLDDNYSTVTVNYTGKNNDEERDAFFANIEYEVKGNGEQPVTLKRPFAQINVGVTEEDWNAAVESGVTVKTSKVTIYSAATQLNLLNGSVLGEETVDYTASDIPAEKLTNVAGNDYHYLSMCYVLPSQTPAENSTNVKAKFTFSAEGKGDIVLEEGLDALTIQRNYRTNIVGTILTGNINFNVVIDKGFDGEPGHIVYVGTEEMKNILKSSNNVTLTADYVVTGNWTPIKISDAYTLDGAGHTISGLTDGLFRSEGNDLTVKNLNVANSNLNAGSYNNGLGVGAIVNYSNAASKLELDNCHAVDVTVNGSTVEDACPGCGVLVGYSDAATTTIKNCSVKNSTVAGHDGNAAGIIGMYGYNNGLTVEGCTVKNVALSADKATKIGYVIGSVIDGTATLKNNTVDGNLYGRTVNGTVNVEGNTAAPQADLYIRTAADLVAFANEVNDEGNSYSGKTVVLLNDIDLAGIDWTPIGQTGDVTKAQFLGTFDGNGKTISGLKVTSDNSSTTNGYGLFGWLQGTVKNLTVSGANITASHNVGVIAGYVEYGTISNCTVSGATITANHVDDALCGDKVGGVAGYLANQNGSKIENCKVVNTTITAGRDAGQVVGCAASAAGVTGCEATNVTLTAGTGCTGDNMGGIIGRNLNP